MRNHMTFTANRDSADGGLCSVIGAIDLGPGDGTFKAVVGDVEVALAIPRADRRLDVGGEDTTQHIACGSCGLKANRPFCIADREVLDVHVSRPIDVDHVAAGARGTVQDSARLTLSTHHNRVAWQPGAIDVEVAAIDSIRQSDDISWQSCIECRLQPAGTGHADVSGGCRQGRNGAGREAQVERLPAAVGINELQFDVVRGGWPEMENAAGVVGLQNDARHSFRADTVQRQGILPRHSTRSPISHTNSRIVVVIPRKRQHDAERS